jgi:hypothetical protein
VTGYFQGDKEGEDCDDENRHEQPDNPARWPLLLMRPQVCFALLLITFLSWNGSPLIVDGSGRPAKGQAVSLAAHNTRSARIPLTAA